MAVSNRFVVAIALCLAIPSLAFAASGTRPSTKPTVEPFQAGKYVGGEKDPSHTDDALRTSKEQREQEYRADIRQRGLNEEATQTLQLVSLLKLTKELKDNGKKLELTRSTFEFEDTSYRTADRELYVASKLSNAGWRDVFSAAVVDFLPRNGDEFKKVFDKPVITKSDVDDIAQWQAEEANSSTTIERFDVGQAFNSSRGIVIFVGHNDNGLIADPTGIKHSIFNLAERCAAAAKLCIFLSCNAGQYLEHADGNIGPGREIGGRQAISATLKIVRLLEETVKKLDDEESARIGSKTSDPLRARLRELHWVVLQTDNIVQGSAAGVFAMSLDTVAFYGSSSIILLTVALLFQPGCWPKGCEAR